MGSRADANRTVTWSDGSNMRRVIAIAAAGISLAGCSSFSTALELLQVGRRRQCRCSSNSTPPGADARTSLGPGCKTPCSVSVTPPEGSTSFLVTYTMPGNSRRRVPVQIVKRIAGVSPSDKIKLITEPGSRRVAADRPAAEGRPAADAPKPRRTPAAAPADAGPAAPPSDRPPGRRLLALHKTSETGTLPDCMRVPNVHRLG